MSFSIFVKPTTATVVNLGNKIPFPKTFRKSNFQLNHLNRKFILAYTNTPLKGHTILWKHRRQHFE